MKAEKRTFKPGDSVSFTSRAHGKPRFLVHGKLEAVKDIKWASGRKRVAIVAIPRGSAYAKLTKMKVVRVVLKNLL